MTVSTSVMPLYHQVAGVLRQQILDAQYPPGSQLPTEDEISAEFAVSRATVRQAVQILVVEGLVVRQAGRGTFVSSHGRRDTEQRVRVSFVDAFETTHRTSTRRIEVVRNRTFPEAVASALGMSIPIGTAVLRTRTLKNEPLSHSLSYLADWVPVVPTVAKLKKLSLIELLLGGGVPIDEVTKTIRAALAGPRVSAELEIELGSAVVQVDALVHDVGGRPVEFTRVWYRADRYEYTARLKLAPGAGVPTFVYPDQPSWTLSGEPSTR